MKAWTGQTSPGPCDWLMSKGKEKVTKPSKTPAKPLAKSSLVKVKKAASKSCTTTDKSSATEIDELFATKPKIVATKPEQKQEQRQQRHPPKDECGDTRGMKKAARPLTDDGYPIFSAEEMQIGKGGGTADCPFDCECCF